MITVYKYEMKVDDSFELDAPESFRPLHLARQGQKICLWAEVDTCTPIVKRRFFCLGTGFPIDPEDLVYVGTADIPDSRGYESLEHSWHFYWDPRPLNEKGEN